MAVLIAFALPLGGVRTQVVDVRCCCPSPERCKCPDHEEAPLAPAMQACHRTLETYTTPAIPAFVAPIEARLDRAAVAVAVTHVAPPPPHAAPVPRRPDAPS